MIKQQTKKTEKRTDGSLGSSSLDSLAEVITSVSFSCPAAMKPVIQRRASELDLSVSQYIRRLVNSDLKLSG